MNTFLCCALLLCTSQDPDPAAAARKWVERLDSAPREAVAALVELGSEASAAPLVEALRSEPPSTGWHAAEAVRALGAAAGKRDKALEAAAAALDGIVLDAQASAETRELAALAFGGVARFARSSAVCGEVVGGGDYAMRLRIALAASLGGADRDAAKSVQKRLKKRPFVTGTLALAALGVLGEEAKGAKADLVRLFGEDDSLHSFLLLLTTRWVVDEIGLPSKAWDKAWSKRRKKESGRTWRGGKGGINLGGLAPREPEVALSFLQGQTGFGAEFPPAEMSLPDAFESLNESYSSVGNMLQSLGKHLAREIGALGDGLEERRWKRWDDWLEHTRPIAMTARYLAEFERRYIPDPK